MGVEVGENGEGLGLDKIWIEKGGGRVLHKIEGGTFCKLCIDSVFIIISSSYSNNFTKRNV